MVVAGLVVVALVAVLSRGTDVVALRSRADPRLYVLAYVGVTAWLLAAGQSLLVLVREGAPALDPGRFRLAFLGGMALRGVVPGGSVSGPPLVASVVTAATTADGEESLAAAAVAEVASWVGSVAVASAGLAGLVLTGGAGRVPAALVGGLAVLTVAVALVVVAAVRAPVLVRGPTLALAAAGRATVGRLSPRVRATLAPEGVERRLDRLFEVLAALAREPRRLAVALAWSTLGWLAHGLALYATVAALALPVSPFVALFVVPVGGAAEGLSLLPGGLGSVEPSQALLLALLSGVSVGAASVATLLFRLGSYWFRLLVGAACLLYLGARPSPGTAE